jgi:hypothetical protein
MDQLPKDESPQVPQCPPAGSLRTTTLLSLASLALKRSHNLDASLLRRDAAAGFVNEAFGLAYCISFSALIFEGGIARGVALGLASLIIGTVSTVLVIALTWTWLPAWLNAERSNQREDP